MDFVCKYIVVGHGYGNIYALPPPPMNIHRNENINYRHDAAPDI